VEELFASLVKDFVDEAVPLVQEVGRLLLKLEEAWATGAAANPILRGIRGGLHTLKGNSAMMGLVSIEHVAHALEDLCAETTTGPEAGHAGRTQLLFEGCDLLSQYGRRRCWARRRLRPAGA
jgi:chemotaxis protein histidine kinase CheA